MKRRTLLVAAAGVAACTAVPKVEAPARAFTAADLFSVEPALLRAAVQTDPRAVVQAVDLDLRVGAERFVIRLQQPAAVDARLPAPSPPRRWQVFALAPAEYATLVTVRQLLQERLAAPGSRLELTVVAQPAMVPSELLAALPLRIDLLVDNREGWFTHFNGALDLRR